MSPDGGAQDPEAVEAARGLALRLLARREHAVSELLAKLRDRGIDAGLAEAVVDALRAEGLQSDARYAEQRLASRLARGYGPRYIAAELKQRGLAAELVDAALEGIDWAEALEQARRGRFGAAMPANRDERLRQARFLERRGFESTGVRAALGDILAP